MKYRILHESSYRMRVHMMCGTMTVGQADYLEYQLNRQPFIRGANVFHRSGNVITASRERLLKMLGMLANEAAL